MTDRAAGCFPNMLLGIQLGRGNRKVHFFQPRVVFQDETNCGSTAPGCAIPEQQDILIGIGLQNVFKILGAGKGIHFV